MFDRFIRMARATRALREQRFEDALQLAQDPLIAGDRRAETIRREAAQRLVARAKVRLEAGDVPAARVVLDRVQAAGQTALAAEVTAALGVAADRERELLELHRQTVAAARAATDAGRLLEAESLLHSLGTSGAEVRSLELLLAERRRQAAVTAGQAVASLDQGDHAGAIERCVRAELLDRDGSEVLAVRTRVLREAGPRLATAVEQRVAAGDLSGALEQYRASTAAMPALRQAGGFVALAHALAVAVTKALRQATNSAAALSLATKVQACELPMESAVADLVAALAAAAPRLVAQPEAAGAEVVTLGAGIAVAATAAGAAPLAAALQQWTAAAAAHEHRLAAARACSERGELDQARDLLQRFLGEQPLHEGARSELALVEQSLAGIEQRLVELRTAVRSGRLRAACAMAAGIAGSDRARGEAQQLAAEARARMALVERGLDEVRVALYGRGAATQEAVRHCLRRLEELAKVQIDHEDLPRVIAAVNAEIQALALHDRALAAVGRQALDEVLQVLGELMPLRNKLLDSARLDARCCDLADRLARIAEVALAAGRLAEVERCAESLTSFAAARPEFLGKVANWRAEATRQRQEAGAAVAAARTALAGRDLAEAEQIVERAQLLWNECPEARALAEELRQLRQQTGVLDRIAALTDERDFLGAGEKLASLPEPSPLLRTRIYDMKQNLARAQGLDGAFLLRVDEGGEQLVWRGESVSIGNIRQARADLPMLANLAGRHASVRRSMSFHGGMQDSVVAEEGEVRIGGALVRQRVLAPGDRVQLGPAMGFVYQRPTPRSLTVGLLLQSGFQIAGTDRVLLMKDRGRDGRILMGPGQDVHVRVAKASGEVEVFATSTGQIRVACGSGGTIDGVPFKGEHPVDAGQIVVAAGISFLLLPWRPAA
jgi:hypothetical protein